MKCFVNNYVDERLAVEYSLGASPCVLLLHGFTAYKNFGVINSLYSVLAKQERLVARMDFSGNGESEGLFGESTFSKQSREVVDVMNYLSHECSVQEFILVGHSMGGSVALLASSDVRVRAVVCLAAASRPALDAARRRDRFFAGNELSVPHVKGVSLPARKYVVSEDWLLDGASVDVLGAVPSDKPVVAFHGREDSLVSLSDSEELAKRGAELIVLETDHFFVGCEQAITQRVLEL